MSASPRVSVGLPVYNAARYLSESIESLLAQDFADLEVIVADNASTDDTAEICRRYVKEDDRVVFLPSAVNRGLAWNHNRTVHAASGTYFKWAAYDDVHAPTFVSRCVQVLDEDDEVVLAYPLTVDIDDDGTVFHEWPPTHRASAPTPSARFRDVMLHERQCFPIYGLMRIDVLRATPLMGAFPSSDQPLLAELALRGRFHEIPERLFLHREHPHRSMSAFALPRARMAFYDPSRADAITFPQYRLGYEFMRAVSRAPIPRSEKGQAYASLAPWARMWRRQLVRSVPGAGKLAVRRAVEQRRQAVRG